MTISFVTFSLGTLKKCNHCVVCSTKLEVNSHQHSGPHYNFLFGDIGKLQLFQGKLPADASFAGPLTEVTSYNK